MHRRQLFTHTSRVSGALILAPAVVIAGCGTGNARPATERDVAQATSTSSGGLRISNESRPGDPLLQVPRLLAVWMRCHAPRGQVETVIRVPRNGATTTVRIPDIGEEFALSPEEGRTLLTSADANIRLQLRQRTKPATRAVELNIAYEQRRITGDCIAHRVKLVQRTRSHSR